MNELTKCEVMCYSFLLENIINYVLAWLHVYNISYCGIEMSNTLFYTLFFLI